jgi:NitT/TauT family transport system permease protein
MSAGQAVENYLVACRETIADVPRPPSYVLKGVSIAGFLTVWWLLVEMGVLGFDLITTPLEALMALTTFIMGEPLTNGGESLYTHSYYTLYRVGIGVGMAVVLAVPLGLLIGWSDWWDSYVGPALELLRPIPPVAWVPIALVAFSNDLMSIVWVVFVGAFFPILINTSEGVQQIDTDYVKAVQCLGGDSWDLFRHVIIPAMIPSMATGIMIGIGIGWIAVVAAEMISGDFGIGYITYQAYRMMQTDTVVVGIIVLGSYGALSSFAVSKLGDFLTPWKDSV